MTELIDWLRVQLDEDAAEIAKHPDDEDYGYADLQATEESNWPCAPYLRIAKDRALAEVDAKRRILEHCSEMLRPDPAWGGPTDPDSVDPGAWHVVKLLALPYVDRPGYRDEWRP